ncbi:MAG: hypothetical protein PHE80_01585 [Candidatus Omnitrophica bacterium]|nr:hypothetical protein [Candidatus Omnitrophota bacterium]MDD5736954.1 hypothetical protein [Candidatus Omnitrophota bacterium]
MLTRSGKKIALLGALNCAVNMPYILWGLWLWSYDIFTHMFFAKHYREDWFSLYNYKWYGGFSQAIYPPLTHQIMAAFMFLFSPAVSTAIVLVAFMFCFPVAMYNFCRIWANKTDAFLGTLASVFFTIFYLLIYKYGQITTLTASVFLLFASVYFFMYLKTGKIRHAVLFALCFVIIGCMHSFSFFYGLPSFMTLIFAYSLVSAPRRALCLRVVKRAFFAAVPAALLFMAVMYPFLKELISTPQTTVVPHLSRESIFSNNFAFKVNLLLPYGVNCMFIPAAFLFKRFSRRTLAHAWWFVLFILGLGGTTPLPGLILGQKMFNTLTFDRFMFWSLLVFAPMLGGYLAVLYKRSRKLLAAVLVLYVGSYIGLLQIDKRITFLPDRVDLREIIAFLDTPPNGDYYYITLGLGDQMSELSMETKAPTLDGNFNKVRGPDITRDRPIEKLDNIKYYGENAISALKDIINSPEKYSLKYILSNDIDYNPMLFNSGWKLVRRFESGVYLWEASVQVPPAKIQYRNSRRGFDDIWWGTGSLAVFILFIIYGPLGGAYGKF